MVDFHIHTDISPDADQALGDVVKRARELGMTHLAITDHYEVLEGNYADKWIINDLHEYAKAIDKINAKNDGIYIAKGIEIGHINRKKDKIKSILDTVDFDFIISSTHFVDDLDLYLPDFFKDKSKDEAYYGYLKEIRDSIDHMDARTSVIGHIGYAARYSPYDDYKLRYEDFRGIIDELLTKIIKRGFGIELNTSNIGRKRDELMPPISIIRRYKQLGGEIITIGSDAHNLESVGKGYDTARQIVSEAGFKYISVYKNLKRDTIKL